MTGKEHYTRHQIDNAAQKLLDFHSDDPTETLNMDKLLKQQKALSPLQKACMAGNIKEIQQLLDNNINTIDNKGNAALHHACWVGKNDIVHFLLDNGADLTVKNKNGDTALHLAIKNSQENTALTLVAKMLNNLDEKDKNGNTAFQLACMKGLEDVATLLAENGAKINAQNNEGNTALHQACLEAKIEIVDFLIKLSSMLEPKNKINFELKNKKGLTALHMSYNCRELIELLLKNGANINTITDKDKKTILQIAHGHGLHEIVNFLHTNYISC